MRGIILTLLQLLAVSAVFAIEYDLTATAPEPSVDVITGPTSCTVPCTAVYTGSPKWLNVGYVKVAWEIKLASQTEFHPLTNEKLWYNKLNITFGGSALPICRRNPESTGRRLEADCSLEIDTCSSGSTKYEGKYRCRVVHTFLRVKTSVTATLEVVEEEGDGGGNPQLGIKDDGLGCFVPKAKNIVAREFTDINNVSRINVTWLSTTKPPGNIKYCNGSRRWKVRMFEYETGASLSDQQLPDNNNNELVIFRPTKVPRDTHFEFSIPLNRDKYYLFQVQNQRPTTKGSTITESATYTSNVHYFGEQREVSFRGGKEQIQMTVNKGETVDIVCDAMGLPPPVISILYQTTITDLSDQTFTLRDANEDNVGDYYCLASNYRVSPTEGQSKSTASKKITIVLQELQSQEERLCVQYTGSVCRTYLFSEMRVFTNGSLTLESTAQAYFERINIYALLHKTSLSSPVYQTAGVTAESVDTCQAFLEAMVCQAVLPYCDLSSFEPRPICRHSCEVMQPEGACGWFFDRSFLRDKYASQLGQLRDILMDNCDTRVNPAGASPECVYVSYESPTIDGVGDQIQQALCVKGKGRGYVGQDYTYTESGIPCQSWSTQSPHKHSLTPSHFSVELLNAQYACRNPGGLGERPWCYTADSESGKRWEYCNVPQCEVCERYEGSFCSALPGYRDRSVYVDWENWTRPNMDELERNMVGLYHSLSGDSLSPGCAHALRLVICHGSLPFCKSEGPASPLKTCSDHCKLFDEMTVLCPKLITEELQSHWLSTSRVTRLHPPECQLGTEQEGECMPSPQRLSAQTTGTGNACYNTSDRGQSYNGSVAVTLRGSQCVAWVDTNISVSLYPELKGVGRGCRNPGQWRETPWCFTPSGAVELCGIDQCEPSTTGVDDRSESTGSGDGSSSIVGPLVFIFIGIPVVVIAAALIGGFIYYVKKKPRTLGNSPPQLAMLPSTNDNVRNMKYWENNQYNMVNLERPLPPKLVETILSFHQISQERIKYVKQLGQGFFGMVFKGSLQPAYSGDEETLVAVKTLKEDSNDNIEAFVNEAKLMFSFNHENIVKILGVSMTKTPYYLVFEYMDKGDLAKFLRENASSLQRRYMNPSDRPRSRTESTLSDDPASLDPEQLSDICKQIASGMEYLSSMNYVHRDLACRNCLVKSVPEGTSDTPSRVIVKIGDFGLSHNLYAKDYYRVRGQAVLPIRWMSPEAIIYGKFSTAGDVWSFGVVMWEIFSFGMQPYYGTSNEEVMERVRHGKVLAKPADCSSHMYTIMTECWQKTESSRPSFTEILMYLDGCRGSVSSDDAQSVYSYISSDAFLEENSDPETECTGGP